MPFAGVNSHETSVQIPTLFEGLLLADGSAWNQRESQQRHRRDTDVNELG
jgi:hypothetical protein